MAAPTLHAVHHLPVASAQGTHHTTPNSRRRPLSHWTALRTGAAHQWTVTPAALRTEGARGTPFHARHAARAPLAAPRPPPVVAAAAGPEAGGETKHAVVVGGGILGASLARAIVSREGWEVTVIEANGKGGKVATAASWAWLNANRKSPTPYRELNLAGMAEWEAMGLADFCGCLIVDDPFPLNDEYPSEEVPAERLREEEPAFAEAFAAGSTMARFYRQEGLLDPVQVTHRFLGEVTEMGGEVRYNERVEELLVGGGGGVARGVRTDKGGEMSADVVILAAGVEIPSLAGAVKVDVPLLDRPGILVHTTPMDQSLLRHIVVTNTCYMLQRPDGAVIIGEDMNGRDQEESVDTSHENARRVLAKAAQVVPALAEAEVGEVTLGRRPYPADGLPCVGPAPGVDGLYVAVTHSGVTLAPLLARLAAEEIDSGVPSAMLAPFRPGREALKGATGAYDLQFHGASAGSGEFADEEEGEANDEAAAGEGEPEPAGRV